MVCVYSVWEGLPSYFIFKEAIYVNIVPQFSTSADIKHLEGEYKQISVRLSAGRPQKQLAQYEISQIQTQMCTYPHKNTSFFHIFGG